MTTRKVLIRVSRDVSATYATLTIVMADRDRTPLLKLRVAAEEMRGACWPRRDAYTNDLPATVDAEIVTR